MIGGLLSLYRPGYLKAIVYMLQSTEYQVGPYIRWYWRTTNFSTVMQRRTLDRTRAAKLLLLALRTGSLMQVAVGLACVYLGVTHSFVGGTAFGLAIILLTPLMWAHLVIIPIFLGRIFISGPADKRRITASENIFKLHPAKKIAVAGSYGKTTMKELLLTVLSEGLVVAATPANKNVSSSHALFAQGLSGAEDILILEYGEGAPGDVDRFSRITHPTHAVITGIAPAHLDHYKTLKAAAQDIFSVAHYVDSHNVFVNTESPEAKAYIKEDFNTFSERGALGWKASGINVSLTGTQFDLAKGEQKIHLSSGLVGKHQVGFLAFVAAFSLESGLTVKQVTDGIAKTKPFEHRMQPYQLAGAWIVDDTYNGNLEGIKAGTQLLADVEAQRKIYVTPGLVDQGQETQRVHTQVGKYIAAARPDIVVLMKNSATNYIVEGLRAANFSGELRIENQPLEFYLNLKHFVAHGDVVVMQNDWTDNYA
jgi:UDP-N-acetylmuramyl pentapeptide synthase